MKTTKRIPTQQDIETWAKTPIVSRERTDSQAREVLEGRPNEVYVLEKLAAQTFKLYEVETICA